jgi:hypothetical protein
MYRNDKNFGPESCRLLTSKRPQTDAVNKVCVSSDRNHEKLEITMSSELKVRHRTLNKQLAQIEREYEELLLEQARWSSQHKSRKGIVDHSEHFVDLRYIIKWIENPNDDRYGERVLCMLPGIEPSTASELLQKLKKEKDGFFPPWLAVPKQAKKAWSRLAKIAEKMKEHPVKWPGEYYLVRDWYIPLMRLRYDDAFERAEEIGFIERFPGFRCREEFLADCLAPHAEHLGL